jgi:hypothetical protein
VQYNLIYAFIWLLIGLPLLFINLTGEEFSGIGPSRQTMMVAIISLVLAAYNFARWGAARAIRRQSPKPLPPVRKKLLDGRRLEYNPEFDFDRPGPVILPSDEDSTPKS